MGCPSSFPVFPGIGREVRLFHAAWRKKTNKRPEADQLTKYDFVFFFE
jgi:hypothetical protein